MSEQAHPALSRAQFSFTHASENNAVWGDNRHAINVTVPESKHDVGHLEWTPKTGEVYVVHVDDAYRRQGLATAMWHTAKAVAADTRGVKPPRHSPQRSDAGDAWARTVGGAVPRRMTHF